MYAKVRQLTRKKTTNCTSEALKDETGKLLTEREEIKNRWKEYIDILTIQETKLNSTNKTPQFPHYTAIRKDRTSKSGEGLLTYVKTTSLSQMHLHYPQHLQTSKKPKQSRSTYPQTTHSQSPTTTYHHETHQPTPNPKTSPSQTSSLI